jgi:hypothetical protein
MWKVVRFIRLMDTRLFAHLYSILVISCTFALVQKKTTFLLFLCVVFVNFARKVSLEIFDKSRPKCRWRFVWNYLFISCTKCMQKKIIIHSFWSTFVRSQAKLFLQITKNHTRTVKRLFFFVPLLSAIKYRDLPFGQMNPVRPLSRFALFLFAPGRFALIY